MPGRSSQLYTRRPGPIHPLTQFFGLTIDPRTLERRAIVDDIVLAFEEKEKKDPRFLCKNFWAHTDNRGSPEEPSFFYSFIIRLSPSKLESYLTQNPDVILLVRHDQAACLKHIIDTLTVDVFVQILRNHNLSNEECINLIRLLYSEGFEMYRTHISLELKLTQRIKHSFHTLDLIARPAPKYTQDWSLIIGRPLLHHLNNDQQNTDPIRNLLCGILDDTALASVLTAVEQSIDLKALERFSYSPPTMNLCQQLYSHSQIASALVLSELFLSSNEADITAALPIPGKNFLLGILALMDRLPEKKRAILSHRLAQHTVLEQLLKETDYTPKLWRAVLDLLKHHHAEFTFDRQSLFKFLISIIHTDDQPLIEDAIDFAMSALAIKATEMTEPLSKIDPDSLFSNICLTPTAYLERFIEQHLTPDELEGMFEDASEAAAYTVYTLATSTQKYALANLHLLLDKLKNPAIIQKLLFSCLEYDDSALVCANTPEKFELLAERCKLYELDLEDFTKALKPDGRPSLLWQRAFIGDLANLIRLAEYLPQSERKEWLLTVDNKSGSSPISLALINDPSQATLEQLAKLLNICPREILVHCNNLERENGRHSVALAFADTEKPKTIELDDGFLKDIPNALSVAIWHKDLDINWLLSQRPSYKGQELQEYTEKLKAGLVSFLLKKRTLPRLVYKTIYTEAHDRLLATLEDHYVDLAEDAIRLAYGNNNGHLLGLAINLTPLNVIQCPNVSRLIYTLAKQAGVDIQECNPFLHLRMTANNRAEEKQKSPGILPAP